jgi:hypothetical protein
MRLVVPTPDRGFGGLYGGTGTHRWEETPRPERYASSGEARRPLRFRTGHRSETAKAENTELGRLLTRFATLVLALRFVPVRLNCT